MFGLKSNINDIHELNEQLFNNIYDIVQNADVYDDDIHKCHYVYEFDNDQIIKDLHRLIHKLNKTLEVFNGMSHKTIKTMRKQLLYLKERFRQTEQSLKDNHTSFISIKNLSQKSTIRLLVKDYAVKDILTQQVLDKFKSLTFISGTLTFNQSFDSFKIGLTKMLNLIRTKWHQHYKILKTLMYLFRRMSHHTTIRMSTIM